MGGRMRDYRRWDYDDETELTLEDNQSGAGSTETLSNATATFPPNILVSSSPIRSRGPAKKASLKEKAQLSASVLLVLFVGFLAGYVFGVRERGSTRPRHSKHSEPLSTSSHEHNDLIFHELVQQISSHNIRDNLKTMTKEGHGAGTIKDLWRSFGGLSVLVEEQRGLLTKTDFENFAQVLSKDGAVKFTTSKIGDDVHFPNSHSIVAFSPAADLNGTLVYGHYGLLQDFKRLEKSNVPLQGSIALIRFGPTHPSTVAALALSLGVKGLIFYPDPEDFGPNFPNTAVRRTSLLTVGQVHEYQKKKRNWSIPSLTIPAKDGESLLRAMEGSDRAPEEWQGGLSVNYSLGGKMNPEGEGWMVRLKTSNWEAKSSIYNVIASIPGAVEWDRYVILGCSHDTNSSGAGDPGIGLAMTTEIVRAISKAVSSGWKPRRSILVISFDANMLSSSGVTHWLQEHHFEIGSRAVTYIDMTRTLKGNQSLEVFSSPLLKEVARKSINKIKHSTTPTASAHPPEKSIFSLSNVQWKSVVSSDEPAFAFLGNLGIPFIRLSATNAPKEYNYPLFQTLEDTYDSFVKLVDSDFRVSEILSQIIAEIILLLADSSAIPISFHDYIHEIKKEFDHFTAEYRDDFHKANLSYAQLQTAVVRLEVIGDNVKSHSKNHTAENQHSHHRKLRREMQHRILNDKLISVEKAFLTRNAEANDGYKHQIIGHMCTEIPLLANSVPKPQEEESHLVNKSRNVTFTSPGSNSRGSPKETETRDKTNFHSRRVFSPEHFPSLPHFFPGLRAALECGRNCEAGLNNGDACAEAYYLSPSISQPDAPTKESINNRGLKSKNSCSNWRNVLAQRMSSLVRSVDAVSAILQSPLVAVNHE